MIYQFHVRYVAPERGWLLLMNF